MPNDWRAVWRLAACSAQHKAWHCHVYVSSCLGSMGTLTHNPISQQAVRCGSAGRATKCSFQTLTRPGLGTAHRIERRRRVARARPHARLLRSHSEPGPHGPTTARLPRRGERQRPRDAARRGHGGGPRAAAAEGVRAGRRVQQLTLDLRTSARHAVTVANEVRPLCASTEDDDHV